MPRPTQGAGALNERVRFERFVSTSDGAGGQVGAWQELFTAPANVKFSRGGESVLAQRLAAQQPAILTMRSFTSSRALQPEDRGVNTRTNEEFNVRETPRESRENRGYLEALVTFGVLS